MSRDDWFRNTSWDDKVSAQFEAKLKRARRKGQYMRIQACMLADTDPEVALLLLERYFAQEDRFDEAPAYVDRATALTALGRIDEAISAYEDALHAELKNPGLITAASIELPYLVALTARVEHYDRALSLLKQSDEPTPLAFPIQHFKWNAAQALIAGAKKQLSEARQFAKRALEAASEDHSGFRYHAKLGLVSKEHADALRQLQTYCDS